MGKIIGVSPRAETGRSLHDIEQRGWMLISVFMLFAVCCMMFNDAVIAFSSQSDSAVILTGGLYYHSGSVLG